MQRIQNFIILQKKVIGFIFYGIALDDEVQEEVEGRLLCLSGLILVLDNELNFRSTVQPKSSLGPEHARNSEIARK